MSRPGIAFDIGNVICHVHMNTFYDFLVKEGVVQDKEHAEEFICGIQHPQDLGLYNIRQGFYRFNPSLPKKTLQDLHDVWLDIVVPAQPMLNLLETLLDNGFHVALLSNIGYDHAGVVRQKCKVFQRCNQHFSCEVGARKPTKLFYQSFALQYSWSDGVLFFDDRSENIEGSKGYFNGIQFDLDNFGTDEKAADFLRDTIEIRYNIDLK